VPAKLHSNDWFAHSLFRRIMGVLWLYSSLLLLPSSVHIHYSVYTPLPRWAMDKPKLDHLQSSWHTPYENFLCSVLGYNFAIEWHRSSTRDDGGSNGETVNEGGRYSVTSKVLRWRSAVIGSVSELTIRNVTEEDLGYYWCVVVKDSNPLPNPSRILHLTNFCASSMVCGSLQLNNPTRRKIRLVTLRTILDTAVLQVPCQQ